MEYWNNGIMSKGKNICDYLSIPLFHHTNPSCLDGMCALTLIMRFQPD